APAFPRQARRRLQHARVRPFGKRDRLFQLAGPLDEPAHEELCRFGNSCHLPNPESSRWRQGEVTPWVTPSAPSSAIHQMPAHPYKRSELFLALPQRVLSTHISLRALARRTRFRRSIPETPGFALGSNVRHSASLIASGRSMPPHPVSCSCCIGINSGFMLILHWTILTSSATGGGCILVPDLNVSFLENRRWPMAPGDSSVGHAIPLICGVRLRQGRVGLIDWDSVFAACSWRSRARSCRG